ncbi:MAG: acylneuraminate cytidylyltransferase family protein [Elusimicrobiota bacterium]|nr:acylneuraminate cytidylyltransferase family protein [Elusimicrobiota bacterium]
MKVSAYLIIRADSTRVANKNFRMLGDRPLYAWIVAALRKSRFVDEIVINTDVPERFDSLPSDGRIRIKSRPEDLRGAGVTANALIRSDLNGFSHETILMSHATNPFLETASIDDAIRAFFKGGCDSLFSVTRFQNRLYDAAGAPVNHQAGVLLQTQDLSPLFFENSCLYVFSKASFLESGSRIGKNHKMFEIDKSEALDIDDEEDWKIAELMAGGMKQRRSSRIEGK